MPPPYTAQHAKYIYSGNSAGASIISQLAIDQSSIGIAPGRNARTNIMDMVITSPHQLRFSTIAGLLPILIYLRRHRADNPYNTHLFTSEVVPAVSVPPGIVVSRRFIKRNLVVRPIVKVYGEFLFLPVFFFPFPSLSSLFRACLCLRIDFRERKRSYSL